MIKTEHLQYSIGTKNILNQISIQFLPGHCNLIVGPNGSGKSTFIQLLSGVLENYEGKIMLNDIDIKSFNKTNLAARRAVLSQQTELNFPITVEEVVLLGRNPHFEFTPSPKDLAIVQEVMSLLEVQHLHQRNYQTLSGGEKQRVH